MVIVTISLVSKPQTRLCGFPLYLECSDDWTILQVKKEIAFKFPQFYPSRQRLTLSAERRALNDDETLSELFGGNANKGEMELKDLGTQISWKTVFLVEYGGPLLIHPMIYHLPRVWYGKNFQHSDLQRFVYVLVLAHFIKRELETIFVHRFSHGTMPILNLFRNSAHYHILSGFFLAYDVYRPKYSRSSPFIIGTFRNNKQYLWILSAIWAFAELSNFSTHLALRALRPAGTRTRGIPVGYGFRYLSCPNYFFETLAWLVICAMTGSVAAWLFTIVAFYTMAIWAIKKHKNYKREFGSSYPRGRKAIIPFVL